MLIDLFNTTDEITNLPHFPVKGFVAVSSLIIEFDTQLPRGIVTLTSTLVDQSSTNPAQQICTFFHEGQSKFVVFQPTRLVYYKMNCYNSFDAVVKIQTEKPKEGAKERNIKSVYLQLDIQSKCPVSQTH